MGIFSRFADIVNSNINSILDKAEDPEKMVRLIIQEMEDTLVEVRSTSAKTLASKKDITKQIAKMNSETADWQAKAELAVSKDREDLARAALMERQKAEEHAEALGKELTSIDDQLAKLQNVKRTLDSSKVDDAMGRFEQYERKIDDLESQVDAYDLGKKNLSDEFAELQAGDKIEDELSALKKKMQPKAKVKAVRTNKKS
jgi:phage shock protein A